jgi:malate dehydrogenase (oxaloacetate-decarboxylating)
MAVALQAHNEGLAEGINADEIEGLIRAHIWTPRYLPYRRVNKP